MGKKDKKQLDKLIDSVMASLEDEAEEIDEALDGNKTDLSEEAAENPEEGDEEGAEQEKGAKPQPLTPATNRFFVTLAIFVVFFSIIGLIVSVDFVSEKITDIRERTALKNEFALFVYPVVINDPPAFSSVDDLQPSTIITCALWKIVLTSDKVYNTEEGFVFIPETDVELAANSIFGIGSIDHRSVFGPGFEFIYNDENKNYRVPENAQLFSYSPLITSVTNVGELYTVTIDYMPSSPLAVAGIEHEIEAVKTLVYTISRTRDSNVVKMRIDSIQFAVDIEG
jgi:hypothetical protein